MSRTHRLHDSQLRWCGAGNAGPLLCAATAALLGFLSGLPADGPLTVTAAQAQLRNANEQRALITVRDASGIKDTPIPLGVQVQAPASDGVLVTIQIGDLPKGAGLSDGSRTAVAAEEGDVVDITGWDLPNTSLSMPSGVTGQFTLAVGVSVENGARPLRTQASFMVNISDDGAPLRAGVVRTVEASVNADEIAVRARQESNPTQQVASGTREPAAAPDVTASTRVAAAPPSAPRDPVAEALASDRKLWLEREQTRTETLTRELVAAHEQIGELKSKLDPPESPLPELKDATLTRLLSKANELIRPGDVSGARLLLERALESGSAEAAFYLAQTYDPRILVSWNVQGIPPDPERARALYNRAHEAGLSKAKDLLELMR
jgi:hypothetical protein